MKNWLLITLDFLACFAASLVFALYSVVVLGGRVVRCAMSLGCGGVSETPAERLAPYGLLVPFALFALGALLARRPLRATSLGRRARSALLLVFALFPLFGYGAAPFVAVAVNAVRRAEGAERIRRVEEFERRLKSAPVSVEIKRARIVSETDKDGVIELTAEVKNVPTFLKYYQLDISGFDEGGFPIDYRGQEGYEGSMRVLNENGAWDFRGYHSGVSWTSGKDTFTTRVRYRKADPGSPRRPSRVHFRLGVWARDDKVYERDCIFYFDWADIPPSAFDESP